LAEGAAILDTGGESTRPGGAPIDAATEQARALPVIRRLASETDALVSVDTYRAETARMALQAGAHVVNDVWGLQREPDIARVAADLGAGLVIMHTGREREKLPDVIADQIAFFEVSLDIADRAGVPRDAIVLDPGFGFAKDAGENLALCARFAELQALGFPLLAGASRKRFLGAATGRASASDRDIATAASTAILRMRGASLFRVHEIAGNRDALAFADAVLAAQGSSGP
ncbi:MAG TPA: dihydropteroate synthase, partial [Rhizobiaceae bacterium]|nr:dihydropteroate synthase [Rhizobiaceae bacterium]